MSLPFIPRALIEMLVHRRPLLVYATVWTVLLTTAVAVASFSPEIAFIWSVTPTSSFAEKCAPGAVRVALDGPPGEVVCIPALLFGRSKLDLFVPPLFAAMVVAGSACFIRAIGLWESDEDGGS